MDTGRSDLEAPQGALRPAALRLQGPARVHPRRRGPEDSERKDPTLIERELIMRVTAAVLYETKKPRGGRRRGAAGARTARGAGPVGRQRRLPQRPARDHRRLPAPVARGARPRGAPGVVERIGPGVETVKPGDHVCSSYIPSCGKLLVLHRRPADDVRAPRQAALVHARRHRRASAKNGQPLAPLSSGRRATRRTRCCRRRASSPSGRTRRSTSCCLVSCGVLAGRRAGLQPRQGAAGRQRRRVRLRRRRAQHHPGRAAGGRGQDHRGRRR